MPNLPGKACATPQCRNLASAGSSKCAACKKQGQQADAAQRGSARQRGYTTEWDKASKAFLSEHPICADPYGVHLPGIAAAECTDHVVAHKGNQHLFWDRSNWQPLCLACNNLKARKEEGGLGWRKPSGPKVSASLK